MQTADVSQCRCSQCVVYCTRSQQEPFFQHTSADDNGNCPTHISLTLANAVTVTTRSGTSQHSAPRPTAVPEQDRPPWAPARPIYRYCGRTEVLLIPYPFHSPACPPAAAEMGLGCSRRSKLDWRLIARGKLGENGKGKVDGRAKHRLLATRAGPPSSVL